MSLLTFELPPLEITRDMVPKKAAALRPEDLMSVEEYATRWGVETQPTNKKVLRAGYADMGQITKDNNRLNLDEPRVSSFLEGQVGSRITTIAESRFDEIRSILASVTEANGTVDELSRALSDHFENTRFWSQRIARTETAALYSQAGIWGMKDSGVAMKEWLSSRDSAVRESHVEADGQRVPMDGDFQLAGGSGQGPGLISSAEESCNCRCTTIPVMEGDDQFLERATAWRAFDERLSAAELMVGRTWLGLFEDLERDVLRKVEG